MILIRLRIIAANVSRRKRLEDNFRLDSQFVLVGEDNNLEEGPSADVFVVDLACPEAARPRFWMVLHGLHPPARLMAVAELPIDETLLQAALHAGAYYMTAWTDSAQRLREVAWCAFYDEGYVPLGSCLDAMTALFDKLDETTPDVQIGALRVELTKRQVKYKVQLLHLTALDFDLIAHLAQNAGQMVPPDELLREVWGCCPGSGGSKEQIKSAMKRLRDKIEPDTNRPRYLLTIHGKGYMMPTDVEEETPLISPFVVGFPLTGT
jgi:DNA-binding winged helix-turn-helix (wHTH) protein